MASDEKEIEIELGDIKKSIETNSNAMGEVLKPLQLSKIHQFMVVIMAFGPSWMLLDAMFIQVPYYQQSQPEAFKMATRMSMCSAIAMVTTIPIFVLFTNIYDLKSSTYRYLIYTFILSILFLTILISITWPITIGNISAFVMLTTYSAASIGHLQTVALIPWLTSLNPQFPALILFGSHLSSLLTAFLGLIQSPGAKYPLFRPSVYYAILIAFVVLSLCSWMYLDKYLITAYLIKSEKIKEAQKMIPKANESQNTETEKLPKKNVFVLIYDGLRKMIKIPIWYKEVYKYAIFNAWIQIITWAFIRSTLPFAISHSVNYGGGENREQYAIELSYVAVMSGSLLAVFYHLKQLKSFVIVIGIFSAFMFVFVIFLADSSKHLLFKGESVTIIVIVFCMRFIDGYLSPMIYKRVGELFPDENMAMNRWIATIEKVCAFFGIWIIYALVESKVIH